MGMEINMSAVEEAIKKHFFLVKRSAQIPLPVRDVDVISLLYRERPICQGVLCVRRAVVFVQISQKYYMAVCVVVVAVFPRTRTDFLRGPFLRNV